MHDFLDADVFRDGQTKRWLRRTNEFHRSAYNVRQILASEQISGYHGRYINCAAGISS